MVDVLFSFLCVLISIRCLGCSFKEIFRTLKDFLLLYLLLLCCREKRRPTCSMFSTLYLVCERLPLLVSTMDAQFFM